MIRGKGVPRIQKRIYRVQIVAEKTRGDSIQFDFGEYSEHDRADFGVLVLSSALLEELGHVGIRGSGLGEGGKRSSTNLSVRIRAQ